MSQAVGAAYAYKRMKNDLAGISKLNIFYTLLSN